MVAFPILLSIHNLNRWLVLLLIITAIVNSWRGAKRQTFTQKDNILQSALVGVCHLQLVLGLALYSLSPMINQAFKMGLGNAMKNDDLRFFAIEHVLVMFIAIMLVQVGRAVSKKQTDDALKHKKALTFFSISFLLMISRIPWERILWPL